jgi:hypothetical protein
VLLLLLLPPLLLLLLLLLLPLMPMLAAVAQAMPLSTMLCCHVTQRHTVLNPPCAFCSARSLSI